jgi:hypothetical protein
MTAIEDGDKWIIVKNFSLAADRVTPLWDHCWTGEVWSRDRSQAKEFDYLHEAGNALALI